MSRIAGVLDDEMSGWELDKAKALLAYGELRPEDEIRIATNRSGTDESMLFAALERSNKDTVRREYLQVLWRGSGRSARFRASPGMTRRGPT